MTNNKRNLNIAIISASANNYSETFIRAHKDRLKGNIFFYYGTPQECYLEGYGNLKKNRNSLKFKLIRKLWKKPYSWFHERFILDSLTRNRIDVILVEFGDIAHKFINPIKESGLPFIVHFHGRDATVSRIIEQCDFYKEIFETAEYVIAVSKRMYSDLLKLGCPEEKLIYNVYGPDDNFFNVNASYSKPKQFLSIGRFVNKKAPHFLILSFLKLLDKHPDAQLLMAGEGELKEVCEHLVNYYGIEDYVKFLGVISPELFRKILSESLALVQHSINAKNGDAEGTPLSILEAGAAGLPVISTKHAGIVDVISDGENGFLVEECNVDGMAERMLRLLEDTTLAMQMGENARKNILEKFTLDKHIHRLDELIQQAYNSKRDY